MRRKSEDNEAKKRENENSRGKEGADTKSEKTVTFHCAQEITVKNARTAAARKKFRKEAAKKDIRSNTASGSKDLCGSRTITETKKVQKQNKNITSIVLQKT